MIKGGMLYSDFIFLIAGGLNLRQYYDLYYTEQVDSQGCYKSGSTFLNPACSISIYHQSETNPIIFGISYSNVYNFGLTIGLK